jgi:predicted Zn-dependent peptidase
METYHKSTLPNGIRIVTEAMPTSDSVSIGIWITTGSRDECVSERGLSHFIEHLLFKGTEKRSAFDISRDIESVGGSINAFTSKECTCYHAKVLTRDLSLAVDILADMVAHSVFDPPEIERERMVVAQEIKMVEDTPDEYIHDLFHRSLWGEHPLGHPVTGVAENVLSFQREQITAFMQRNYTPDRIIVAAAGNLDHRQVVDLVEAHLGHLPKRPRSASWETAQGGGSRMHIAHRELEQVHFCLGTEGIPHDHRLRFAGYALNTLLGGNMSSRLFQEVREKRGLAYSIYSFFSTYTDTGIFGVYAGTTKEELEEVLTLILQELRPMRRERVRAPDLSAVKEYLRGTMILSLEGSEGRMGRLAKDEIRYGRHIPMEEVLEAVAGVSDADIADIAREILDTHPLYFTLLGAVEEEELPWQTVEL